MATVVDLETSRRAKSKALDALVDLVEDDLKAVNRTIVARMHSPVALIPQLAGHIVAAGGKRLRPVLTLAASKLCGYGGERHIRLATCVEFIHMEAPVISFAKRSFNNLSREAGKEI